MTENTFKNDIERIHDLIIYDNELHIESYHKDHYTDTPFLTMKTIDKTFMNMLEKVVRKRNENSMCVYEFMHDFIYEAYHLYKIFTESDISLPKLLSDIRNNILIPKNSDYSNSADKTFELFGTTAYCIRIYDKINRLENLCHCNDGKVLTTTKGLVNDESIIDTIQDIIGYCTLALYSHKVHKNLNQVIMVIRLRKEMEEY